MIKYTNTVGYANADGNLIVTEQSLVTPSYRIYLYTDPEDPQYAELLYRIQAGEAHYLPYLGKNECSAWWDAGSVRQYACMPFQPTEDFRIDSIFIKDYPVRSQRATPFLSPSARTIVNQSSFIYFERLPIGFQANAKRDFVQYELAEFAFSDWYFKRDSTIPDLYRAVADENEVKIIQLF